MAYKAVYTAAMGENATKTLLLKKNEGRGVLKAYVRDLENKHIDYNDAISDLDRERMRFPLRDKTPKPRAASALKCFPRISVGTQRQCLIRRRAKEQIGGHLRRNIHKSAPLDSAADLRNAVFSRKTSRVYDYTESELNKAVRYENSKGEPVP